MNGTYEERVCWKGYRSFTFTVNRDSWSIRFYFPGPDARYNGSSLSINQEEIDDYITSYRKNWEEYQLLKNNIPEGGSFRKEISIKEGIWKKMSINVGSSGIYADGVCIDYLHLPINDEEELNSLLEQFEYCKSKAPKIMEWLSKN
ncbi:MAG: hypothetical protein ABL919_05375 [Methylococcales bacterium]|nr:hypothetical protein [Methylococcaceae bacterium]